MAELELGTLNVITFDALSNAWQRAHGFLVDEAVKAAAARCTELTSLTVTGRRKLTDEAVKAVASHCPGLSSLNVGTTLS